MIVKEKDKYILYSLDGKKRLGEFPTQQQAEEREKEIQRIKRAKALKDYQAPEDK